MQSQLNYARDVQKIKVIANARTLTHMTPILFFFPKDNGFESSHRAPKNLKKEKII